MISQTYKREGDIITIESDDDDIQEVVSTFNRNSNTQTFSNGPTKYIPSILTTGTKRTTISLHYNGNSHISLASNGFSTCNKRRYEEVGGTATAAIFNEKPLNIYDLSPMNELKTSLSGLTNKQNHVIQR